MPYCLSISEPAAAFRCWIIAIGVVGCFQGPLRAAERWYTHVDTKPLVTMQPGLLRDELPNCFEVLDGKVTVVESPAREGVVVLQSAGKTRLACAIPSVERSVLTVEVKPSAAGGTFAIAVAGKPSKKRVELGYQMLVRTSARSDFALQVEMFTPEGELKPPHFGPGPPPKNIKVQLKSSIHNSVNDQSPKRDKERQEADVRKLQAESASILPFHQRWIKLRIELTPEETRFWCEGILIASVEKPALDKANVFFELSKGDQLRNFRIEASPQFGRGFLPLDLHAQLNGRELAGSKSGESYVYDDDILPARGQVIEVAGIPFLWNEKKDANDHLDVGRSPGQAGEDYWRAGAEDGNSGRLVLRVPRRQYRELAIIAAADLDQRTTNMLDVRMLKPLEAVALDSKLPIPHWNAVAAEGALRLPCGSLVDAAGTARKEGALWLLRVPLDPGAFQSYLTRERATWLELELLLAPSRGDKKRSGVHVFAATLIESPVEMFVDSTEPGNVFMAPNKPAFRIRLRNTTSQPQSGAVEVAWKNFYGKQRTDRMPYALEPNSRTELNVPALAEVWGLHDLDARLLAENDEVLIRRHTTYANLPPDDRDPEWSTSPFGMWLFGGGHYGGSMEQGGTLLSRIGVRWSFVPDSSDFINRFHIRPTYKGLLRYPTVEAALKDIEAHPHWTHMAVFEETSLGPRHYGYFFPELLENPAPMPLTPEEEERFKQLWDKAMEYCKAVRQRFPKMKLIFGCGAPHFVATFMSRGFPREYMDGIGLDYLGDRIYLFYYMREVAKHYGYGDVPMHITEGFYIGSERGFYPRRQSEQNQSEIYIQGFLRGLALGVERFGAACNLYDAGGSYYYTGYGPIGLCHKAPELNPKPGYPAYGTMTRMLDRAKFTRMVPTGSTVTYVAEFDGKAGKVYAVWTVAGNRPLAFTLPAGHTTARLTDSQGNSRELRDGGPVEVGTDPVWIDQAGEIRQFRAGSADYGSVQLPGAKEIYRPDRTEDWKVDATPCREIERLNSSLPIKQSEFQLSLAAGRVPETQALQLELTIPPEISPHRLHYSTLRPSGDQKMVIPGGSRSVGIWVDGNGAASVAFELRDAKGRRWHSVRGPSGYDPGMPYRGPHAFDGWRYVTLALPGEPGARDWHLDAQEKGPFALPAEITALYVQQHGSVLVVNHLERPTSWRIGPIVCERTSSTSNDDSE